MYEVRVEAGFCAAHQVRMYDGQLEPIHQHDWKVDAVFRGPKLDEIGVLVDFAQVEKALHEVAGVLDQQNLNQTPVLAGANPTAEHVARWVFDQLRARLGGDVPLTAVYVREAPGCVAGYCESSA